MTFAECGNMDIKGAFDIPVLMCAIVSARGWHVVVIWECNVRNTELVKRRLMKRLKPSPLATEV